MKTELKKHPRAISRAGLSAVVVGALTALACLVFGAASAQAQTVYIGNSLTVTTGSNVIAARRFSPPTWAGNGCWGKQ